MTHKLLKKVSVCQKYKGVVIMTEEKYHFRDRKFCLLLYPDDETHVKALEIIKANFDYAMISHNRDIKADTGEVKKEHWHVVLKTENNAIWNTALAKELGITPNYIERCRNLDRALMYLIHFNDIDKVQYSVNEVEGTLKKRLKQALAKDDKTEQEKVSELVEIITNSSFELKFTDFVNCALEKGYFDVVRRSSSLFMKLVQEHNELIQMINNTSVDKCLNDW